MIVTLSRVGPSVRRGKEPGGTVSKFDGCPSSDDLRRLTLSQLGPAESASVREHLAECDLCCETFNALGHDEETKPKPSSRTAAKDATPPPIADLGVPSLIANEVPNEWDLSFLSPPLEVGDLGSLGAYRVLGVLGVGGMGIVFHAEDPKLHRELALKVIKPELARHADSLARFLREAQAIAAIDHDNIVSIFEVNDETVPYLAMPLLKGQTLADRMREKQPLTVSESLRIAREIASGLDAAHEQGVVHRDIKPANIWLEGDRNRVKLLDFGLARPAGGNTELTATGTIAGTPLYMAPEQIEAQQIDERADLYSLGCVLYRMLTGRPPFEALTPLALLSAVATQIPDPPARLVPDRQDELPQELSTLVLRLLEKAPDDRPASAKALVDEIERIEMRRSPQRDSRVPFSSWLIAATLLGIAGMVCLTVYIIRIKHPDGSETTVRIRAGDSDSVSVEREKTNPRGTEDGSKPHLDVAFEIGPPVKTAVNSFAIAPAPIPFRSNEPLVKHALVSQPAPLDGVISWTIHSKTHRDVTPRSVVSMNGKYIATACRDFAIRVWEVDTGRLVKILLGHEKPEGSVYGIHAPMSVGWSPDGQYLASVGENGPAFIWKFETGRLLRQVECPVPHPKNMHWSPDGLRIVVTDSSQRHVGVVLDVRQGKPVYEVSGISASWAPDGKTLAVGDRGGRVHLLAAVAGSVTASFTAHSGPVQRIGFSADGNFLGTGSFESAFEKEGRALALWRVEDREVLRRRDGRYFIAFSTDGKKMITGGERVRAWWTESDTSIGEINMNGEVPNATWLPDGDRVMVCVRNGGLAPAIWNSKTGQLIQEYGPAQNGIAGNFRFSPDGQRLLHDYNPHPYLGTALWTLRPMRLVSLAMPGHMSVWSPDSLKFAHGDTMAAHVRDATNGDLRLELSDAAGKRGTPTQAVAFSTDGVRVAKLNSNAEVTIVEIDSAKTLQTITLESVPSHVSWRPGAEQIAWIDQAGVVRVRDLESSATLSELATEQTAWPFLSWSKDGVWLAIRGTGGTATGLLWNVDTDEKRSHQSSQFLSWLNDGSYAIHAGGIQIYDAEGDKRIRHLPGLPKGNISPDGQIYVTSENNATVFYSSKDGRMLGKLHCLTAGIHKESIKYMTITSNGHYHSPTVGGTNLFVYIVQTVDEQLTLTPEEFESRFGWRNDPVRAELLSDPSD